MEETKKISFKINVPKRKEAPVASIFSSTDEIDDLIAAPRPTKMQKTSDEGNITSSRKLQDLGNSYAEEGSSLGPIHTFFATLSSPPDDNFHSQKNNHFFGTIGNFSAAIAKWDEALQLTPQNPVLWELKAQSSLLHAAWFNRICSYTIVSFVCFLVFLQQDNFFAAVECAEKATKLNPSWPEAFLTLARAQINFGELTLALESLKRAITLPTDDAEVKASIAHEFERVVALIEEQKSLEKNSGGGRVVRGQFVSKEERACDPYFDWIPLVLSRDSRRWFSFLFLWKWNVFNRLEREIQEKGSSIWQRQSRHNRVVSTKLFVVNLSNLIRRHLDQGDGTFVVQLNVIEQTRVAKDEAANRHGGVGARVVTDGTHCLITRNNDSTRRFLYVVRGTN